LPWNHSPFSFIAHTGDFRPVLAGRYAKYAGTGRLKAIAWPDERDPGKEPEVEVKEITRMPAACWGESVLSCERGFTAGKADVRGLYFGGMVGRCSGTELAPLDDRQTVIDIDGLVPIAGSELRRLGDSYLRREPDDRALWSGPRVRTKLALSAFQAETAQFSPGLST
jgi:hypothetical protein